MRVDNRNKQHKLIQLEQKKRNETERKMREIENNYNKRVEDKRLQHELKFAKLEKTNTKRFTQRAKSYENRLKSLRDSYYKLQDTIDTSKKQMQADNKIEMLKMQDSFQENHHRQKVNQQQALSDIELKAQDALAKLRSDNQETVKKINRRHQLVTRDIEGQNRSQIAQKQVDFEKKRLESKSKFDNHLLKQQYDQKQKLKNHKEDHNKKIKALNATQNNEYNTRVRNFKRKVADADKDFKLKYKQIVDNHQNSLKDLKSSVHKGIEKTKQDLEKIKKPYVDRVEDPFYHPFNIDHTIINNDKDITIEVPLAEYEKDFIQISGKGRNVRISYSRNYKENYNRADGSHNKYNKVESYAKEFELPAVIDAKKISREFVDGKMIFTLPKA